MMSPEEAGRKIAQVAAKNTCLTHVGCGYYLVPFYKEMTNGTITLQHAKGVHAVRLFRPAGSSNRIMGVCDCLDMGRRDVLMGFDFSERTPLGMCACLLLHPHLCLWHSDPVRWHAEVSEIASEFPMCAHTHAALAFASAKVPSDIPKVAKLTEDGADDVVCANVASKEYVLAHLDNNKFLRHSFSVEESRRIKCIMCKYVPHAPSVSGSGLS